MSQVIIWCSTYWWVVALVAAVLFNILNRITPRFQDRKGVVRWLLIVLDILDVIKLSGKGRSREGGSSPLECVIGLAAAVTLAMLIAVYAAGCGSLSGIAKARAELPKIHAGLDLVGKAGHSFAHLECMARANECRASGYKSSAACTPWNECDKARTEWEGAVQLAEDALLKVDAVVPRLEALKRR